MNKQLLVVSQTPHIRGKNKTSNIMLDVFIALCPAAVAGVLFFGPRALVMMVVSIAACVLSEEAWCRITKKQSTIKDGSAIVSGLLLALNVPVTLPFWMIAIAGVFAMIIVKAFFGGIGKNFMNPALAARAFLMASWTGAMTTWVVPFTRAADAVTGATPLAIANGAEGVMPGYLDMLLGNVGGCIGETSALCLLIGGIYLIARRIISPIMPVCFIGTVAVLTWLVGGDVLMHILSGGLMLGAFFMATDYVTSPITKQGMAIAGIFCGAVTVMIRQWGGYPEGVSYSILLMNIITPLIDKYVRPRRFGEVSAWKKTE